MALNAQALELNETIKSVNPHVYELLSERGKAIYFPKRGILAQTAEAKGKAINATIGTALEDNGSPMTLHSIDGLLNLKSKDSFGYAPSPGNPNLRSKWKEMMVKKNPSLGAIPTSSPVVTSALTHGLSMAAYLFVNPGDEVILPDLYWENYDLIFELAYNGQLRTFQTFTTSGGFDLEAFKNSVESSSSKKKIVLLNFPNNPTGYTITIDEAEKIKNLFLKWASAGEKFVVLVDDAYFGLVYEEGIIQESIFAQLANLHENILAVKLDGPTKEDYVWGFRVGFVTFGCAKNSPEFYSALESKIGGAIRGNISNSTNLGQTLLMSAYTDEHYETEKADKYASLKRRYKKVRDIFRAHPEYSSNFSPLPFNSGYFMCVKVPGCDAEKIRQTLLNKYSTGLIAQGEVLRIAFSATPFELLEPLFENLNKAVIDVKQG